MKAIESIKAAIAETIVFNVSKYGEPFSDLLYIKEQTEQFRDYVKGGIERMIASELFTKREVRKVENYANDLITLRAELAESTLRRIKREAYKF